MRFKDFLYLPEDNYPLYPLDLIIPHDDEQLNEYKFRDLLSLTDKERLEKAKKELRRQPPKVIYMDNGQKFLKYRVKNKNNKKVYHGYIKHHKGEVDEVYCNCADFFYRAYYVLEKEGLVRLDALEKQFDPKYHEAADQTLRDDAPDGLIIEEIKAGYIFKGKILRSSLVTIAKNPKEV